MVKWFRKLKLMTEVKFYNPIQRLMIINFTN